MKVRGHPQPARRPGRAPAPAPPSSGSAALARARGARHHRARATRARWRAEAAAAGAELVLAVGGDGTANEVAWGLLGTSAALGLVPVGSGNGLARTLRHPPDAGPRPGRARGRGAARDGRGDGQRPAVPQRRRGRASTPRSALDFHEHGRRGGRRGVFTYVRLSVLREPWTIARRAWMLDAGGQRFEGRASGRVRERPAIRRRRGAGARGAARRRPPRHRGHRGCAGAGAGLERAAALPRDASKFRRYRHCRRGAGGADRGRHRPLPSRRRAGASRRRLEASVLPRALRVLVPRATADDPRRTVRPPATDPAARRPETTTGLAQSGGQGTPGLLRGRSRGERRRTSPRASPGSGSSGARTWPPRSPARSTAALSPATP